MPYRTRLKDERIDAGSVSYQEFSKPISCANAPVWATYYTGTNLADKGKFVQMTDVIGNGPNRSQGLAGYRFNPMTSISCEIDSGVGNDWEVEVKAQDCTGTPSQAYNRRFRRVSGALTLGRQHSGFAYPSLVNLSADTAGITSYRDWSRACGLASAAVNSKRGRGGGDTNLFESIAEVDKSLKLLSDYFEHFRKLLKSAQKLNPREFARGASSIYLMTRYGLSPTVKDIFSTLEGLRTELGSVIETTRASETINDVISFTTSTSEAATFTIHGSVVSTFSTTARCMALDQYVKSRFDALSLSFKNLATVGWELVPYSFVVDWFVNVGDLLGSLIPNFGIREIGSCTAVIVQREDVWRQTGSTLNDPSTFSLITPPSGGMNRKVTRLYSRSIGLPRPTFEIKTNFGFDRLNRALDSSSLLIQQLRQVPAARR
jgi:hypothetical protein